MLFKKKRTMVFILRTVASSLLTTTNRNSMTFIGKNNNVSTIKLLKVGTVNSPAGNSSTPSLIKLLLIATREKEKGLN